MSIPDFVIITAFVFISAIVGGFLLGLLEDVAKKRQEKDTKNSDLG